ncbi:L-sorbosone dehydrogenase [Methylobacterium tarhaniae]|uniref:L-sorbosone dehydrogenase n=1 Tax=Methylobacterium tarhaniae TaxID=1187852 RepID=A0A0J6TER5_9HYPH|nr:sorbosone dehydrogenase family protein [Methylobacterium tarhaniae]KMO44158.1 L-sorbosone dehydrogenase [Methylobacterium tarhaniae]
MSPRLHAVLAVCALLLAGCQFIGSQDEAFDAQSQVGPDPVLPEPQQYLLPPMRIARAVGWSGDATPSVPQGFRVKAFATGLAHPRQVSVLPNGDVLVVEANSPNVEPVRRPKDLVMGWVMAFAGAGAKGGNRITLLRDADGDGTPEVRSVLLEHINSPFGVALVGQDLYVAATDALLRFPYREGDTRITDPGTKVADLPGGPIDHHWTKALAASPDGTKLYVGVGSNSNITEHGLEAERGRAEIWEIDRATGAHRTFASGLRNPTGLDVEPQSGRLWAIVNERDEIGPNLVPDYLTAVRQGAFYGWPYSYWGQHVDPRVQPPRPDLVASAVKPDYGLSSHVAPLGLAFSRTDRLGADFRGGAFVGEHGSWDRQELNGYKVAYVPFADGRPSGKARDVVTGLLDRENRARGRPVGVAVDPRGALLVADDLGNTVWRVTPAGP